MANASGSVSVDEPRDPPEPEPDGCTDEPACLCGSSEHASLQVGTRLSDSGTPLEGIYICPGETTAGIRGAL